MEFTDVTELSSEELNTVFLASLVMNTGVAVYNQWVCEEESAYVVPIADVRWRLGRFLDDGYTYVPEETEFYDEARDAMVCPTEKVVYSKPAIHVYAAELVEENRLFLLVGLPEQKGVTKEYLIRFDDDSWRYESIHALMPDGIEAQTPLP